MVTFYYFEIIIPEAPSKSIFFKGPSYYYQ
jgi:hypothetical protein